jgi:predicted Zn finger-like uncharacterized protein
MPLTTRCRRCGRLFPVYAAELKADRGRVPCPQCGKRFDAVAGLIEEQGPPTDNLGRRHPAHRAVTATLGGDVLARPRRRGRAGHWLWGLGVLLLLAGLAIQGAWWARGELLRYPQIQAVLANLCPHLGCVTPLPRMPGTIEIVQPLLAADPDHPEALRLRLILVNRAAAAQRAPILQLELQDERGALLGVRRFGPDEYLAPGSAALTEGLPPDVGARAGLDVALPDAQPAGFRVRLL